MQLTFKSAAVLLATAMLTACGEPATEEVATAETTPTESEAPAITYNVNTETSRVMWKGSMLGMYSHEGNLKFSNGSFSVKGGKIVSGNFTVDMGSINPTDENFDEEKKPEMLVGHLSSADFFDVENHPTATLVLEEGGKAKLTVRGITNEVLVKELSINDGNGRAKGTATLVFDRTKFDVSFTHPVKENVLSDDIELSIEIAGTAS